MKKYEYAIECRNVYKYFKLNTDKPFTLKERLIHSNKNKKEKIAMRSSYLTLLFAASIFCTFSAAAVDGKALWKKSVRRVP
jgi:hypothetical protein